ncbi:MAG: O-antigen ligase family protein [Phycisphaerae bacterium]|nr:MAG: O-antigen ligase family protein [Phycisphaerae bacterium]MBE7457712.1 O-antigen ligase family protein [Planctomycetia bacterium]MCQ3920235.1 hypothetical protein [Planctomycetota bacterium]MCK6463769.1 O-antigen ligase family protein [Phycisphaerae bacterium]MCL4717514.1 O-antigen ligase family protein [Phycisphaerae bacterium]
MHRPVRIDGAADGRGCSCANIDRAQALLTRTWDPDAVRPLHVVMIVLVVAMLCGGFLLLSVPESVELVDGARAWGANSLLRSVVQLLCLNYEAPARHADAIKSFCLMFFTAAALICVSVVLASRRSPDAEEVAAPAAAAPVLPPGDTPAQESAASDAEKDQPAARRNIAPLIAAHITGGLFVAWLLIRALTTSAASPGGGASSAISLALAAAAVSGVGLLWSFALSASLTRSAARLAVGGLMIVSVIAASLAIWYFYERNPHLRAKFPFGNPTFLAACLLPGLIVSGAHAASALTDLRRGGGIAGVVRAAGFSGFAMVLAWAILLSNAPDSVGRGAGAHVADVLRSAARPSGAIVGLVCGVLTMLYLRAGAGRKRYVVGAGAVLAVAGAWYGLRAAEGSSEYGRDATARVRFHGWTYAVSLFQEHPIAGCGPGGFTLGVDQLISREWRDDPLRRTDVEEDPRALSARLGHAHNEWLEVLADSGSIGFVLLLAMFALTFMAGMNALESDLSEPQRRALIALLAALAALIVEECFGVGLRFGEVPCAFYTVLGLTWAMCGSRTTNLVSELSRRRDVGLAAAGGAFLLGMGVLVLAFHDFRAARAGHDAAALVREGRIEDALVKYAAAGRPLRTDRAMQDMLLHCEAALIHARTLQRKGLELSWRAQQETPANTTLLAEGQRAVESALTFADRARTILHDVLTCAPGYLGASRLNAELLLMGWEFATARNRNEEAAAYLANAAQSLEIELARQPFNADIAVKCVQIAGPMLDFERAIVYLARPLRHEPVVSEYVGGLTDYADATPGFDDAFGSIYTRAMTFLDSPVYQPADAVQRWAPEIVRVGGILHVAASRYADAVEAFDKAAGGYERYGFFSSAPLASAYALAELADARFLATPASPEAALATLDRAISVAPGGEQGDAFKHRTTLIRRTAYLAAGGREEEIRTILTDPGGVSDSTQQNLRLSAIYADVAFRVLQRRPWELPPELATWIARAIELDPRNIRARFVAANLAMLDGKCADAEAHLRQAASAGAPVDDVLGAIVIVHRALPDCEAMPTLWAELAPNRPMPPLPEFGPFPEPPPADAAPDSATPGEEPAKSADTPESEDSPSRSEPALPPDSNDPGAPR